LSLLVFTRVNGLCLPLATENKLAEKSASLTNKFLHNTSFHKKGELLLMNNNTAMHYMIIERFHPGKVKDMYQRFEEKGRMLPEGVNYVNSWINEPVTGCYQVMGSESPEKLEEWMDQWKDLVDFEVIPVISSAQAREKI
jgi:hypothetical protein